MPDGSINGDRDTLPSSGVTLGASSSEKAKTLTKRRPVEGQDTAWQYKLLPFLLTLVSVLTVFFLCTSLAQLSHLRERIEQTPTVDMEAVLPSQQAVFSSATPEQKLSYAQWRTLTALEVYALQRRYHQANVLLSSRVWFGYLGFLTGMILAMVGASFILAKLRESVSTISALSLTTKLSISSASPGLILAVAGVLLMVAAMTTQRPIQVDDAPLYVNTWQGVGESAAPDSDEKILEDASKKLGSNDKATQEALKRVKPKKRLSR